METVIVAVVGPLGIVLGWWLSQKTEKAKWRREEQTRWHQERFKVYADFMAAIEEMLRVGAAWNDDELTPTEFGAARRRFLVEPFGRLQLLASTDVAEAGRWAFLNIGDPITTPGPKRPEYISTFLAKAREELGIE